MARSDKRKVTKEIRSVARKAKEAMYSWIIKINREPSDLEVRAWQSGYLAGIGDREES
jgi:hypothetical protein